MEFQTRKSNPSGDELNHHPTLESALNFAQEHANTDYPVWKISFALPETKERVRLVRTECGWTLESVFGERYI